MAPSPPPFLAARFRHSPKARFLPARKLGRFDARRGIVAVLTRAGTLLLILLDEKDLLVYPP